MDRKRFKRQKKAGTIDPCAHKALHALLFGGQYRLGPTLWGKILVGLPFGTKGFRKGKAENNHLYQEGLEIPGEKQVFH
jgi:hypothetical protein